MSLTIEYRVRAVTRYVVTRHEVASDKRKGSVGSSTRGEFDSAELADTVSTALAAQEQGWMNAAAGDIDQDVHVVAVPYGAPPPGKVMRCKVVLHIRIPQWGANVDADGKYLGRTIQHPTYVTADPTDPANVKADGERLIFGAVCGSFDKDGNNSVEENRIFGYWSPSFMIDGHVRNEAVLACLEQGAEYYVDFTPAPKS